MEPIQKIRGLSPDELPTFPVLTVRWLEGGLRVDIRVWKERVFRKCIYTFLCSILVVTCHWVQYFGQICNRIIRTKSASPCWKLVMQVSELCWVLKFFFLSILRILHLDNCPIFFTGKIFWSHFYHPCRHWIPWPIWSLWRRWLPFTV